MLKPKNFLCSLANTTKTPSSPDELIATQLMLTFSAAQEAGGVHVFLNSKSPSSPGFKLTPHEETSVWVTLAPITLSSKKMARTLPDRSVGIEVFKHHARCAASESSPASNVFR